MEEPDIKHQLYLLQKEVEAAVSLTKDVKLNLLSTWRPRRRGTKE